MDNENNYTLCWKCAHAVPKTINDRYIRGCEWSIAKKPVKGWKAIKTKIRRLNYKPTPSYCVISCPKFKKG